MVTELQQRLPDLVTEGEFIYIELTFVYSLQVNVYSAV